MPMRAYQQILADNRGTITTILADDDVTRGAILASKLSDGSKLSQPLANLSARLADFVVVVNSAVTDYRPTARANALRTSAARIVSPAFNDLQKAALEEKQNLAAGKVRAISVDPATDATRPNSWTRTSAME